MNTFFQTAYGTSPSAYSRSRPRLFQGEMQGNGTVPVLWMIMSIILIKNLYLTGLATPQYSPMSQMMFTLIALMNVDDKDMKALDTEGKSTSEVIETGKRMIDTCELSL